MQKRTKGRLFTPAKREKPKKNLNPRIRTTGIYPLNRKSDLERLLRVILEDSLITMTEQVEKVFLKKFNKKSEEITKCRVNRETKSLMYRQAG